MKLTAAQHALVRRWRKGGPKFGWGHQDVDVHRLPGEIAHVDPKNHRAKAWREKCAKDCK